MRWQLFEKISSPRTATPLNLVEGEATNESSVTRPPIFEVYMRMAEELAKRSTCARLKVGTVITDRYLENVVAIGYNGNARRFPNECDGSDPGACGCIHSEQNALVKAPGSMLDKGGFHHREPMRHLCQIAHPGQHLTCVLP